MVWRLACCWARVKLEAYLRHLDSKLMGQRSSGLRHVGVRERRLVTRVGEVVIRRAYYVDPETGEYRFLLDEALGLPARERVSRGFKAEAVAEAAVRSFRGAARKVTALFCEADGVVLHLQRGSREGHRGQAGHHARRLGTAASVEWRVRAQGQAGVREVSEKLPRPPPHRGRQRW